MEVNLTFTEDILLKSLELKLAQKKDVATTNTLKFADVLKEAEKKILADSDQKKRIEEVSIPKIDLKTLFLESLFPPPVPPPEPKKKEEEDFTKWKDETKAISEDKYTKICDSDISLKNFS